MNEIPQLYMYDPKTKELVGQRDATVRPNGKGYILQGTFATSVVPPDVPDGYAARWTGKSWELVEDHRQKTDAQGRKYGGTAYWLPGDTWQSPERHLEELGPLPEGAVTTRPEKTPEEVADAELAVAQAKAASIVSAKMQAATLQTASFSATEFMTLAKAKVFEEWAAGKTYIAGYRLAHEGIIYEIIQDVTALEGQEPGKEGMLAIYRPLSVDPETGIEPDGSLENPYVYLHGMDVEKDCYYSFNGKRYLSKADMPACVWDPGTAGLWQWEEVA